MSFTFSMGVSALVLFVVLMIFTLGKSPLLRIDRAGAAFIGAMSIILSGVLSLPEALAAIDYRTIIILFSMMLLVSNLKLSGFFEAVGDLLLRWGYNRQIFLGTVITGSMANLIVAEAAKRQGIRMGAAAYMQIGFPVTILLAIFSYAWLSFLR